MPEEFEINMLRCIYCGFCQEVCPEEAIFLQKDYSLVGSSREEISTTGKIARARRHAGGIQKWKLKLKKRRNRKAFRSNPENGSAQ